MLYAGDIYHQGANQVSLDVILLLRISKSSPTIEKPYVTQIIPPTWPQYDIVRRQILYIACNWQDDAQAGVWALLRYSRGVSVPSLSLEDEGRYHKKEIWPWINIRRSVQNAMGPELVMHMYVAFFLFVCLHMFGTWIALAMYKPICMPLFLSQSSSSRAITTKTRWLWFGR